MKILENMINTGKSLLIGTTLLASLCGCATTTDYTANQFCGTNPIPNGTVTKSVKITDDHGTNISYLRIEKDNEKFVKMDYDGDNMAEEQHYTKTHKDGSRTHVRCYNDGIFKPFGGEWKLEQTEYSANGEIKE